MNLTEGTPLREFFSNVRMFLFPSTSQSAPVDQPGATGARAALHRFAIPHTFGPTLTVRQAAVAAVVTFSRIFLGCVLFAVWGSYSALALTSIHSHWWRAIALLPLICLFFLMFVFLMAAISAVAKWAHMG
jgi:hypothetical protein